MYVLISYIWGVHIIFKSSQAIKELEISLFKKKRKKLKKKYHNYVHYYFRYNSVKTTIFCQLAEKSYILTYKYSSMSGLKKEIKN